MRSNYSTSVNFAKSHIVAGAASVQQYKTRDNRSLAANLPKSGTALANRLSFKLLLFSFFSTSRLKAVEISSDHHNSKGLRDGGVYKLAWYHQAPDPPKSDMCVLSDTPPRLQWQWSCFYYSQHISYVTVLPCVLSCILTAFIKLLLHCIVL